MTFKYIELFAGIGGFRSALDGLGGECVFASEIDKHASQAYRALYNGAPELHGDITQIDAYDIPDHVVLVGGFPCQAFSVAGQRKGFEDARGTLFFEIARIASAKQPRLMLLENVKGLLSHDGGRTFETMCAILNDIGYAIDFRVLNSKHFGVPQNRERIFVVADRDAEHAEWEVTGSDVVAKAKRRAQALGVRTFNFDWPENGEVATRLRDVLEAQVDEKYYLSEEKTAKLIAQLNEKDVADQPIVYGSLEHYGNDQMNRVYSVDGLAPTITVVSGGGREQKIAEPQLEQYSDGSGLAYTVDDNYAKGTSPGDIGKGRRTHVMEPFTVIQKTHSASTTVKYDETGTLQAARLDKVPQVVLPEECGYCGNVNDPEVVCANCWQEMHEAEGEIVLGNTPRYRIRKLTPRECWRLQGFTDAQHDAVLNAGISDSQRYKQAGNAVTVNVIRAVGGPLVKRLKQTAELAQQASASSNELEAV